MHFIQHHGLPTIQTTTKIPLSGNSLRDCGVWKNEWNHPRTFDSYRIYSYSTFPLYVISNVLLTLLVFHVLVGRSNLSQLQVDLLLNCQVPQLAAHLEFDVEGLRSLWRRLGGFAGIAFGSLCFLLGRAKNRSRNATAGGGLWLSYPRCSMYGIFTCTPKMHQM